MKLLTGSQMAEIDKKAISELNIDGLILMENAGIKVYQRIMKIIENWSDYEDTQFKNIVVISGKGNNGGDGFVIARHLVLSDIPVSVYAAATREAYKGDALKNYLALENFVEINIIEPDKLEELRESVIDSSIVVDALLGTGIRGTIEGFYKEVIEVINESDGLVVAVDIPSGVDSETGKVVSVAVEADFTETLAAPKLGLFLYPGADCAGKVNVVDIGLPEHLINNCDSKIHIIEDDYVYDLMPLRFENSNKGSYGNVITIAGSRDMTGSGLLSALSVLKIGAGLSTLATPWSLLPYYTGTYPEITYLPLLETSDKTFSEGAVEQLVGKIDNYKSVLIGPGIAVSQDTIKFTEKVLNIITEKEIPVVIDADALNCISELSGIKLSENAVMTPHPKELSRLLSVSVEEILLDKLKYLQMAVDKYNCNVILKGSKTIVASSDCIYINPTGNSALATGGTGDVLSGIIAGLIAQGLTSVEASVCGVYIHGLSGDLAAEINTEYSVLATDVIKYIPKSLKKLGFL